MAFEQLIRARFNDDGSIVGLIPAQPGTPAPVPLSSVSGGGDRTPLTNVPVLVAHRGAAMVNPEMSLQAFNAAYAAGVRYIGADCNLLSNGGIAVIHDSTVDRTTGGTGNVNTFTPNTFKALQVDALATARSAAGYYLEPPLLFSELLDWAVGKDVVLVVEPKAADVVAPMLRELTARKFPKDRFIWEVQTNSFAVRPIAEGWKAWSIVSTMSSTDFAATKALGFDHVGGSYDQCTSVEVARAHAAGLSVWAFTVAHRYYYDQAAANGVDFVVSDDPVYLSRTTEIQTKDHWSSRKFDIGMIGGTVTGTVSFPVEDESRGLFNSDGTWGYATSASTYSGALQGYACPIKNNALADSFSISLDIQFDSVASANRWVGILACAQDDRDFRDSVRSRLGLHFLVRQNGTCDIYSVPESGGSTQIGTTAGTTLTLGTKYTMLVTVTPTQVSVSCNGVTTTIANTTPRGGYFYVGRNGCAVKLSNLVVA